MKKIAIALVLAASGALSACNDPRQISAPSAPPVQTDEVDECPRADGQPCK